MNLSNKLNLILKDYSSGNKASAYKRFKKIYLQNNKDIKLRYNLAVMQQELAQLDKAKSNYISWIKNSKKRPITIGASKDELIELVKKRSNLYSKALHEIKCDSLTKNQIANNIIKIYETN